MSYLNSRVKAGLAALSLAVLAACGGQNQLPEERVDLGNFRLGYNIVVAENAQVVQPSRKATAEEWEAVLKEQVDRRFGRYEGEKLYHLGVGVAGYALAVPGIPVVLAPKSALVITVNIYDDSQGENGRNGRLTEEAKQITVLESLSGDTVVGSGLTKSREQQMENLAFNAVAQIERFLVENRDIWFDAPPPPAPDDSEDATE